jgi:hypothetical protein
MASEKIDSLSKSLSFGLGKIRRDPLSERRTPLRNEEPRLNMHVKPDARSRSVRKYARGGGRFAKLLKFANLDVKLLEHNFFYFAKNRWMPS